MNDFEKFELKPEDCDNHGVIMTLRRVGSHRVCDYCGECMEKDCCDE